MGECQELCSNKLLLDDGLKQETQCMLYSTHFTDSEIPVP